MLLKSFIALNYRRRRRTELNFKLGTNLIYGDSNAGKSSAIRGIITCLSLTRDQAGQLDVSDIRAGADHADLTLVISLPLQVPGSPVVWQDHTINRIIRRDGKHKLFIDGVKISKLDDAKVILTEKWGLPEPDQLHRMIWQKQQSLDKLIREETDERRLQYTKLLGYHSIKELIAHVERVKDRLNAQLKRLQDQGSTNPLETEQRIAELNDNIRRLEDQLALLPTPAQIESESSALRLGSRHRKPNRPSTRRMPPSKPLRPQALKSPSIAPSSGASLTPFAP